MSSTFAPPCIEAIVFDCDGVLVDSTQANIATYHNLLVQAGYDAPSDEAIRSCYSLDLDHSLRTLAQTDDPTEIERMKQLLLQDGIRESHRMQFPTDLQITLGALGSKYRLGLATSRSRLGLGDVFKTADIQHHFEAIVAREDYDESKPNPASLLTAAAHLNIDPLHIVYVGDSESDILAAHAAGMQSVHVASNGLGHHLASRTVTQLSEVTTAITSLAP